MNTAWAFVEISEPKEVQEYLTVLHFTDAVFSRAPPLGKRRLAEGSDDGEHFLVIFLN